MAISEPGVVWGIIDGVCFTRRLSFSPPPTLMRPSKDNRRFMIPSSPLMAARVGDSSHVLGGGGGGGPFVISGENIPSARRGKKLAFYQTYTLTSQQNDSKGLVHEHEESKGSVCIRARMKTDRLRAGEIAVLIYAAGSPPQKCTDSPYRSASRERLN